MQSPLESTTPSKRRVLPEKICLIIPPSLFLLDERVFMSLGILKVADVLERSGIGVEVLDLSGVKNFTDTVCDYARERNDVQWYGLTSTTPPNCPQRQKS